MLEKKSKVAEIKTKPSSENVEDFITAVDNEQKRNDSFVLLEMMKEISGEEPVLWGGSIVGFGNKRYKSPTSGREVDWFLIGFSPRKANLSLYLTVSMDSYDGATLEQLGKHKTGGGCLYVNKLADINLDILKELTTTAFIKNKG